MFRKSIINLVLFFFLSSISFYGFCNPLQQSEKLLNKKPLTIGIIVPLDHAALREIVAGFKETLTKKYGNQVTFNVQNAQGDIKIQSNIIELFIGKNLDMIVPIGTTATQMTAAHVKKQPIVSLAAEFSEQDRQKHSPHNITGVLDEIGGIKKVELIKQVLPNVKKLTVIYHTGNEKNFKEIEEVIKIGTALGIEVQKLGIYTLTELDTASKAISKDSEAVLILKDHLVVSGIRLLVPMAEKRGIPLIASDEGSVEGGAAFALGVKEKAIGEEGGQLAIKILEGAPIASLPMQTMKSLVIFFNKKALESQHVDINKLKSAAEKDHYSLKGF
jgi:putative tryptophan/tyrosine transport system substrate-binding protein